VDGRHAVLDRALVQRGVAERVLRRSRGLMMHAIKRRGLMMHAIKRRDLMMHAIKRGVAERVLRRSRADNVPHQQRMTSLISG
jgi:hypothetical protein